MNASIEAATARHSTIASAGAQGGVAMHTLPCGRLFTAQVSQSPIFVLNGSFFTHPADDREVLLQSLTSAMLVNGTRLRSALALADALEGCGASMSFDSEGRRVAFSVQACVEDLALVTGILSECLLQPSFDAEELALEQERMIADLRYRALFPRAVAGDALMRALYPPGDVRHLDQVDARIAAIECFDISDVQRCYRQLFAGAALQIAAVGAIDSSAVADMLCDTLGEWHATPAIPTVIASPATSPQSLRIEVPGERYAVVLGQRVSLRCEQPDYVPLSLANHMVGGTFTSRLVRAVRDERGLSYGVDAALSRPDPQLDGHWRIELTANPDKVEEALAVARSELARFVNDGVTRDELEACKIEAIGAFQVNMASLFGISETLLAGAEQGHDGDYAHTWVRQVEAVTVAEINRVIREHLRIETLTEVVAGSDC